MAFNQTSNPPLIATGTAEQNVAHFSINASSPEFSLNLNNTSFTTLPFNEITHNTIDFVLDLQLGSGAIINNSQTDGYYLISVHVPYIALNSDIGLEGRFIVGRGVLPYGNSESNVGKKDTKTASLHLTCSVFIPTAAPVIYQIRRQSGTVGTDPILLLYKPSLTIVRI